MILYDDPGFLAHGRAPLCKVLCARWGCQGHLSPNAPLSTPGSVISMGKLRLGSLAPLLWSPATLVLIVEGPVV